MDGWSKWSRKSIFSHSQFNRMYIYIPFHFHTLSRPAVQTTISSRVMMSKCHVILFLVASYILYNMHKSRCISGVCTNKHTLEPPKRGDGIICPAVFYTLICTPFCDHRIPSHKSATHAHAPFIHSLVVVVVVVVALRYMWRFAVFPPSLGSPLQIGNWRYWRPNGICRKVEKRFVRDTSLGSLLKWTTRLA